MEIFRWILYKCSCFRKEPNDHIVSAEVFMVSESYNPGCQVNDFSTTLALWFISK